MSNWLVITWMFMVGWMPHNSLGMGTEWTTDKYLYEKHNNCTKIEFNIDACLWDRWDIYGGIENFQSFDPAVKNGISFAPFSVKYTIGTEVYLLPKSTSNLNVSVYAKHGCQHPVRAWAGSTSSNSIYDSCYTDIGIKVTGKACF